MPLPKPKGVPTETVQLSSGPVEVRGLTTGQAQQVGAMTDSLESNALAISMATGTDKPEVVEFVAQSPAGDVKALLECITRLSGLDEGARFQE